MRKIEKGNREEVDSKTVQGGSDEELKSEKMRKSTDAIDAGPPDKSLLEAMQASKREEEV
jgi:hypothetical protein